MFQQQNNDDIPDYHGITGAVKKSIDKYGLLRWFFTMPVIFIYCVSYALLSPEYITPYQVNYEDLNKRIAIEKKGITTPVTLPSDLFYYSSLWQDMSGENPFVRTLMTASLEYLFKSMNYLKDIQDNDESGLKTIISDKVARQEQKTTDTRTVQDIYNSISSKGEYFSRLFEQLFTLHGLKKLGKKYSDTDLEVFFNMLCTNPEEKKFRRILGAFAMNAPYYLVIKNSVNEYYQNSDILIPVDLFSFTLFMMFLDNVKNRETRPTIDECRKWVFSVIVPDEEKLKELEARSFSVQEITREEMIMPNPGYFSKGYNEKKHKAIDIASGRGTMIRSPLTGTVTYYEKSPKKTIVGNFIIIKDEKSKFNIFICHMDNKDFIENHSTEGELAKPIANLTPDWVHPLKKGQFFEVVGNTGKSTGAHTHIQVAQRTKPYTTYDFLAVNKSFQKQFNEYLSKNSYWQAYSRNEQLLLSILGMVITKYDSTRHFADRDPETLRLYGELQKNYTPTSTTIDPVDLSLEKIPENILHTYFSKNIQEQVIIERYEAQLKYYAGMFFHYNFMLKLVVPLASNPPEKTIPLTPWQAIGRRRERDEEISPDKKINENNFYQAINKYFLYKIMQLNDTPRDVRDQMLSDPMYTGFAESGIPEELPDYTPRSDEERINTLGKFIRKVIHQPVDITFFNNDDFCSSVFTDITDACKAREFPLDSGFGFFRYHMTELQQTYQSSKFIQFPETREFKYDRKYDAAIRSFFLDIFELAAEYKNFNMFRELYRRPEEQPVPLFRKVSRKINRHFKNTADKFRYKFFHTPYPVEPDTPPYHLHSVLQKIINNIVTPVSFESRTYSDNIFYRAAETSIFYTMIYEVYLTERERYMKLFPAEQLVSVIDAIGLFDSMFKVFCDNAAQKQLIDNEHNRITRELEQMEKELDISRKSKRQLQEDFTKKTANIKTLGDSINKHAELFSNYFTEEEKISKTIAYLEQSLDRYRDEISILKEEKVQLEKRHQTKIETMNREIEDLKSKNMLEQHRFRIEMKNISYHKEKADQEIIDLKAEIEHLKKETENLNKQFNQTLQKTDKALDDSYLVQKKYAKTIQDHNVKATEQEISSRNLQNDFNNLQKRFLDFVNITRNSIGPYAKEMPLDEITRELQGLLNSASAYRDRSSTIRLLQDQQKNDKRSLALNATLITDLKEQVEKLEIQLKYLQDTTSSIREKDLESENKQLSETIKELKLDKSDRSKKQQ